jgi:3-isopropylmalate/(R)-2-methylmalate dehydratase small subunit
MARPFTEVTGMVVPLPRDNVDTDQIIPARFLTAITRTGLGDALFADWRHNAGGSPDRQFILNQPGIAGRPILVSGDNFGCGSSREHAVWALMSWGFRVVVAPSFGSIFRANALKNGLLPVAVGPQTTKAIHDLFEQDHQMTVTINLSEQSLVIGDGSVSWFDIDAFSKRLLLDGLDELGYLLTLTDKISAFERQRFEETLRV